MSSVTFQVLRVLLVVIADELLFWDPALPVDEDADRDLADGALVPLLQDDRLPDWVVPHVRSRRYLVLDDETSLETVGPLSPFMTVVPVGPGRGIEVAWRDVPGLELVDEGVDIAALVSSADRTLSDVRDSVRPGTEPEVGRGVIIVVVQSDLSYPVKMESGGVRRPVGVSDRAVSDEVGELDPDYVVLADHKERPGEPLVVGEDRPRTTVSGRGVRLTDLLDPGSQSERADLGLSTTGAVTGVAGTSGGKADC